MPNELSNEQALEILRSAAAEAQLKLADHIAVQKAVEVIRNAIQSRSNGEIAAPTTEDSAG